MCRAARRQSSFHLFVQILTQSKSNAESLKGEGPARKKQQSKKTDTTADDQDETTDE